MARKGNFFEDTPDLRFHLTEMVDWELVYNWITPEERQAVSANTWQEYRDTWLEVLSTVGEICANTLAPNAAKVEKEHLKLLPNGDVEFGPALQENMRVLREAGCTGIGIHPKYGGLGGPFFVELALGEMIARACPSTYLNSVWFSPIAHLIESFGNESLRESIIPLIAAGEWSGSMSLTEPDVGSDLGAMRTYGEKQPDGSWKIFGTKRFISNGCGQLSLVLAKNGKNVEGLKSLSLFLVLRKNDDGSTNYAVTKLEEKVGLHGSATCELQFDGSKAVLLGKEGEGFLYMLRLMNDARIAVGLQGLGLMDGAWRLASEYAQQRKAWGKPIARHELIAEMLLDMEVDIRAFRSLCYQAGYFRSMAYFGEKRLQQDLAAGERAEVERKIKQFDKLVRKWTPLIKWFVGEKSYVHARNGLQIHGGYGFTTEYRAEWYVRESLILALYEGTSQIQALMCIKDTMKDIIRKPTEFIEVAFGQSLRGLREGDPNRKSLYKAKQVFNTAVISLLFKLVKQNMRTSLSEVKKTDILKMIKIISRDVVKFENLSPALLHSERICEMKVLVAMGNCLVRDMAKSPERKWIADRFFHKALPRMHYLKSEIENDDPVIASRLGYEPQTANANDEAASAGM
jgi:alkylation response protein AidB-like acyl-CoA dehydrogenase